MPLQRMPFGLIQYQMEFFTCTNVMQVREPEDFRSWRETMTTEFPGRFMRLFAGPMWSGRPVEDRQNPQKARVNVACASQSTQWRRDKKSTFTSKPELQTSALDALKSANPDGRFWIKLDATDLRVAVMESGRHVWNGDVDLGDGELQKLRQNYDDRFKLLDSLKIQGVSVANMRQAIPKIIDDLDADIEFLDKGLKEASDHFHKKFQQANCPEETLKEASWEVIEFQTLLQQSQELKSRFEDVLPSLDPNRDAGRGALNLLRITVKDLASSTQKYLRNVFKKKRTPASHVMVTMLSDEKRDHKPYALPVQYLPCQSLKDQFVRDLNVKLKEEMKARDMKVAGTVTDGEFCSLRSRGETRPLHLWQIIHDARDSVGKMSKTTLLKMLELIYVAPDGKPVVSLPNPDIPDAVILELDRLRNEENLSLEDAVTNIRGHQVPAGHSPYPFRRDTRESLLDKLRSVVATCRFRANIEYWKERGADFSSHLYVPESDPVTEEERHDRGDHNHLFRRMAKSVREGKDPKLNFEAFNDALHDPESGLTYAALIGKRKQSLKDAERLLSIHVADSLRRKGHVREARHVQLMANWHEASDGRGLSQLKRAQYNYEMLNYVLDDWMPWHRENYDFSTIDINRPVDCVRGFSRETLVELTTNIESQEHRRRMNSVLGYPEHPRAGVTDDLETLFAMFHRYLGPVFTLKQFKEMWPKIVREFTKRMDKDLPFYYWTINERFTDEELPSFDECPDLDDDVGQRNHPLRLHRLRINNREDGSVLVPARAVLPARHRGTLRQRLHRPETGAPPVRYHMRIN